MERASAAVGSNAWLGRAYPTGAGRLPPAGRVRCACRCCGSHVHAVVLKQTISGLCATCGSCDITSLGS